ncbi:MAG: 3-deoxy-D-manno-octulosonic acid transferase [Desulfuromonadaceae bacterium]|nr:3-deoxy-D-manno-octulosonic acid transferase [Desulfuromonadaceae bacterium]MDD2854378.1 3-deoxy-D-manno-octulosonic acid transferase [Desulfuromonadaceae bacterium]
MFFFAYNILSIFLLLPVIIYHFYRSISRGRAPAFRERFGIIPAENLKEIKNKRVIWLHAVSVGESIAARPLLKELRSRYPDHAIVISNTTETGRSISNTFPEKDLCIYFPFDFLPAVSASLGSIRPQLIIIMETEIWPNFTKVATGRGIPVMLANGRISDRSFSRYKKFDWFFRQPLKMFSSLCMQTATDMERIVEIGASKRRTAVSGNLKYDIPLHPANSDEIKSLRARYSIPENLTLLTAASTHAGEEQYLIDVYKKLALTVNNLFLIVVPRHPERASEVSSVLKESGLIFKRRTQLSPDDIFKPGEALLVDTIGEMMNLYSISDVAFVGGSFVPTGGHNLLEPASVGVATVFGPHMTNFREVSELVLHYGAGIQANTTEELFMSIQSLIMSVELRRVLGQNGLKLIRSEGGATARHMENIAAYL